MRFSRSPEIAFPATSISSFFLFFAYLCYKANTFKGSRSLNLKASPFCITFVLYVITKVFKIKKLNYGEKTLVKLNSFPNINFDLVF